MYMVTILFKSGNTLKLKVKSFKVKTKGDNSISEIEWNIPNTQLLHINLEQIEAITSRKCWF